MHQAWEYCTCIAVNISCTGHERAGPIIGAAKKNGSSRNQEAGISDSDEVYNDNKQMRRVTSN